MNRRNLTSARSDAAATSGTIPTEAGKSGRPGRPPAPRGIAGTVAFAALGCALVLGANGPASAAPTDSTGAPAGAAPAATAPTTPGSPTATIGFGPTTRPGASNTGVVPGTALTEYDGDMLITTPGAVVENRDIHGFVLVEAPGVIIRNCIIRGGVADGENFLISHLALPQYGSLLVQDTELAPSNPSVGINGVRGGDMTLQRMNIHTMVDGVEVVGDNTTISDSWIHDDIIYPHDPVQQDGPSHSDGIQLFGSPNTSIINNTVENTGTSVIQLSQQLGATADLLILNNYFDGGACSVNLSATPRTTLGGITMTSNRFGDDQLIAGCAVIANPATQIAMTANVWDATNTPITRTKGA